MLMHQGIGLDRFNALPRARAIHALFACCCSVKWAEQIADNRPYADHEALLATVDIELLALSQNDLDRIFDSVCHHSAIGVLGTPGAVLSVPELAKITQDRIDRMLGPAEGYPEY